MPWTPEIKWPQGFKRSSAHRPSMDHQEGFGCSVKGAGSQRVWLARNNVAQVVIGMGGCTEGEFGNGCTTVMLVIWGGFKRVQEVTWWRRFKDELFLRTFYLKSEPHLKLDDGQADVPFWLRSSWCQTDTQSFSINELLDEVREFRGVRTDPHRVLSLFHLPSLLTSPSFESAQSAN